MLRYNTMAPERKGHRGDADNVSCDMTSSYYSNTAVGLHKRSVAGVLDTLVMTSPSVQPAAEMMLGRI